VAPVFPRPRQGRLESGFPAELTAYLRQLGRDHRRFGVTARHYPEFIEAVAATVREFASPAWSDEVTVAWDAVLAFAQKTMLGPRTPTPSTRRRGGWPRWPGTSAAPVTWWC
jgi:Globin